MLPTRFAIDLLHPDRVSEDGGRLDKLFVRLTYELFNRDHPELSYRDGGGKDGAIDLWSDASAERHVFECKQIGVERKQQPWEAAQRAWRQVRDNLKKNFPLGQSGCHAPYLPWFSKSPQITQYTYVVSCSVPLSRQDELRHEIKSDFEALSVASPLLGHLMDVEVAVVDWDGLRRRLESQAQVRLRWFRDYLPVGLSQLTDDGGRSGFRRYQYKTSLPYYSLREHLDKFPQDRIQDETALWRSLAEGPAGLVISGIGGIGKSRLMMEIGRLAAQDGWVVCEALANVSPGTIDGFSRRNLPSGVLYLFDYLENLPAFRDTSLHIAQLAGSGIPVRFVASARESFVRSEQMIDDSIVVLAHSPEGCGHSAWWDSYRAAVFEHIAEHLAVSVTAEMPKDIPAVAVLEAELRRCTDPSSSVDTAKVWVVRRLAALLHNDGVSEKSLALLAAQCPFDEDCYTQLSDGERNAFKALINAGWIEVRETELDHNSYWVIHDYLADQMVLNWLNIDSPRGLPKSAEIREILRLAYALGSLGSAIATLQRIVGKVSGFEFGVFSNILKSEISGNEIEWKAHRQDVLYTKLLSPAAKVTLLHQLGEYWQGAEEETWFQLEIAALAKALTTFSATSELPAVARAHFESVVISLAALADERNMLVTYGLRLLPRNEQLKQITLEWLAKFADHYGATYVIRAWLDVGLSWRQVEPSVGVWLARFGGRVDAQFILAAWLRASEAEGVGQFKATTLAWCEQYRTELVAQHVYSAWLTAGGESEAIARDVKAWLAQHSVLEDEPSFLFRRWLRSGGSVSTILPHLRAWIDRYKDADCATYVYSAAVDFMELRPIVHEAMLNWIASRSTAAIAHLCVVAWLRAGCDRSLVAKYIRDWLSANGTASEAGEVIAKWLEAGGKLEMVWPYTTTWIEIHADSEFASPLLQLLLENKGALAEIRELAQRWLAMNGSFLDAERVLSAWLRGHLGVAGIQDSTAQWCQKFQTETRARYVYEQWLINGGDPEVLLANIMAWLVEHGEERDAGRVLSALLRAGVPWAMYREYLKQWTKRHKRDRDATFFYHAWLADPKRKPSLIESSVRAWLYEHGRWKDAEFVLNAWLKRADASTDVVRAGYETWMAIYNREFQAKTVKKNWEAAIERERRVRARAS